MAAYLAKLCDALARRTDYLQKEGRQIWDAKNWHETQSTGLQGRLEETQRLIEEQQRWAAELEQAKQFHENRAEATQQWMAELEQAKTYHETRCRTLEERVAGLVQEVQRGTQEAQTQNQRREALAEVIRQVHSRRLGRWLMRSITLPDWLAEQLEAEAQDETSGLQEPRRHD